MQVCKAQKEDGEIGVVALCLLEAVEDQCAVAVEVADDRIDLGQCEPHGLSLAVCASQSKTNAQPPQRRWPNCITQSATPSRPNMWPRSYAIPRSRQRRAIRFAR